MPAAISTSIAGKKRKREEGEEVNDTESAILLLEQQILESRINYNKVVTLLSYAQNSEPQQDNRSSTLAFVALCRVFSKLIALGNLSKTRQTPENEAAIIQWLNERYTNFKDILLDVLCGTDISRQSTALTLLMRLVKVDAEHLNLSEKSIWRDSTFSSILEVLVRSKTAADSRDDFKCKYIEEFIDVRFHTFACLRRVAIQETSEVIINNIISMLAAMESMPETKAQPSNLFIGPPSKSKRNLDSLSAHKRQAQEAWLAVLRHNLSKQQRKTILGLMSHLIAPWFLNVELLMDFLTDSFNQGGATSLMALSGLFYLINEKNLDYPQFYHKLYSLLDDDVLHSKHRSRFFRLLDTFLSSTHLPAALVASFLKRLSRLSLNAPPAAIVVVVPVVYNLLKSHPACTFMIHRAAEGLDGEDPFCMEEQDPTETDAIESSLWEIHTMQDHYHPNVATIAKIISEQFTKQSYNLEDFLDHSYDSMLNAELVKDIKRPPEIEYCIPKKIFTNCGVGAEREDSLLTEICQFT